jgi:tRNA pseudouridine55 synthase
VDGVLVIDKPAGITSHDVVAEVRRRLGTKKVGHGGTLDPDATGVLVIGIGRATRFLSYSQRALKRYSAVAAFGTTTTTQDASGPVIERRPADIARDDVEKVAKEFVGTIDQIPPMVSAVKVGGERLYKKARRGEEVERNPRSVVIQEMDVIGFDPEGPRATFEIRCSAGTYVRTLVHDIGQRLGCGAHLESLRRTEAGGFGLADAIGLDEVEPERVRPLIDVVACLPRVGTDGEGARLVGNGRRLPAGDEVDDGALVAICHEGRLLGVYRRDGDSLVPDRVVGS